MSPTLSTVIISQSATEARYHRPCQIDCFTWDQGNIFQVSFLQPLSLRSAYHRAKRTSVLRPGPLSRGQNESNGNKEATCTWHITGPSRSKLHWRCGSDDITELWMAKCQLPGRRNWLRERSYLQLLQRRPSLPPVPDAICSFRQSGSETTDESNLSYSTGLRIWWRMG